MSTPQWQVVNMDVLEWAKTYDGPKFHAIVTDPPYHLTSIVKRFSKTGGADRAPSRVGAYTRHASGFMGKTWDGGDIAFRPETWAALAKHLHPGAFIMAFAGTRGYHRMAVAMEDAGLILHPALGWLFSSGFPKATRIDTQIDRKAGAEQLPERTWSGGQRSNGIMGVNLGTQTRIITGPTTELAQVWAGHRYSLQALKPAFEFIAVAQKPYANRPIDDITRTGAGALNIDAGRIGTEQTRTTVKDLSEAHGNNFGNPGIEYPALGYKLNPPGRWPANFCLSHVAPDANGEGGCRRVGTRRVRGSRIDKPCEYEGDSGMFGNGGVRPARGIGDTDGMETVEAWECVEGCPAKMLDEQAGSLKSGREPRDGFVRHKPDDDEGIYGNGKGLWHAEQAAGTLYGDEGGASRFFFNADWALEVQEQIDAADPVRYCAKASRAERDAGLEHLPETYETKAFGNAVCANCGRAKLDGRREGPCCDSPEHVSGQNRSYRNPHPTLKPLALVRWLASLLLPPDAYAPRRILVPFAGSASEMIGAMLAGWEEIVGVELTAEYVPVAEARLRYWQAQYERGRTRTQPLKDLTRSAKADAIPDTQLSLFK